MFAWSANVEDAGYATPPTNAVFIVPSLRTSSACISPSPSKSNAASSSAFQLPDCDNDNA